MHVCFVLSRYQKLVFCTRRFAASRCFTKASTSVYVHTSMLLMLTSYSFVFYHIYYCTRVCALLVVFHARPRARRKPTCGNTHTCICTRRPGAIDPALRRPGRFDQELALAPPDAWRRADILRHHLRGVEVSCSALWFGFLAF